MKIVVKLLREGAKFPEYKKSLDVGADVYQPCNTWIHPGMNKIPLGIGVHIPQGFEGNIYPRSSTNDELGLLVQHPPIDSGYTGEIHVMIYNPGDRMKIKKGTRLVQLLIRPVVRAAWCDDLGEVRGNRGFGSSGK